VVLRIRKKQFGNEELSELSNSPLRGRSTPSSHDIVHFKAAVVVIIKDTAEQLLRSSNIIIFDGFYRDLSLFRCSKSHKK
jgi:hypothetical protein